MGWFKRKRTSVESVLRVIAIILVWRGIWYMLDGLDNAFFDGSHLWSSVAGVLIGLAVISHPEGHLRGLDKL